jgi:single-stranded-DNA-specific exonuclease
MSAPKKRTSKSTPPPTPSEAAFERALDALVGGGLARDEDAVESAAAFVTRVFAQRKKYLEREPYAGIGDSESFHTKIVGVSFEGRQDVIAGLRDGSELQIVRQPNNAFDANAIAVHFGELQLGFLKKDIAKQLAPLIDAGTIYRARIASLTGGGTASDKSERNRGVNILVWRSEIAIAGSKDRRAARAHVDGAADEDALRRALIGEHELHPAQRDVLARVDAGKNVLALFGTGRGKSFCFQFTAALRALRHQEKTLVIYPLRALANDQYEALARKLDPFGLRILRANGAITPEQREDLFAALRDGTWDIILATPEFLEFHRQSFTAASTPHIIVVDEAHHVYESRHRAAYGKLGQTIASLGSPQVLAFTATADDASFAHVVRELGIAAWVIDPTVRDNLQLAEARETKDKMSYLTELFESEPESRGIVYCMSRSEAQKVAAELRKRVGDVVAFYHAGMPSPERLSVERFFREDALRVVVATSAFGEGVDLPNVRHVVHYHLNFDFTEFNQQSGRAGRDGEDAQIHLLFGQKDRGINEFIIDREAPTLPALRELYRGMRGLAADGILRMAHADAARTLELDKVNERTVSNALRIFEDAGLVESGFDEDGRFVRFLSVDGKVDLTQNERFAEGEAERESFARFADLALSASIETLERIVNRPIYPDRVDLVK